MICLGTPRVEWFPNTSRQVLDGALVTPSALAQTTRANSLSYQSTAQRSTALHCTSTCQQKAPPNLFGLFIGTTASSK